MGSIKTDPHIKSKIIWFKVILQYTSKTTYILYITTSDYDCHWKAWLSKNVLKCVQFFAPLLISTDRRYKKLNYLFIKQLTKLQLLFVQCQGLFLKNFFDTDFTLLFTQIFLLQPFPSSRNAEQSCSNHFLLFLLDCPGSLNGNC